MIGPHMVAREALSFTTLSQVARALQIFRVAPALRGPQLHVMLLSGGLMVLLCLNRRGDGRARTRAPLCLDRSRLEGKSKLEP
ncbi:hypothetical protein EYF80_044028 [Liparis tanakae]|uniref:Uncharacterized protein n=1 Tax=Liparis tanakae TaxID=230148 RepID=A0A4Z2FY21_9TELE|nr:hypothetical protein EYF80_044028 [Liparis tanakae]